MSPSSAGAWRRKVETSITLRPKRTWQRRNRRPITKQLRNSFLTCWGCALVPMSKSFGLRAEQQVAHAAAHQVGQEPVVLQPVHDLERVGVDVLAGHVVLGARQDAWRSFRAGSCVRKKALYPSGFRDFRAPRLPRLGPRPVRRPDDRHPRPLRVGPARRPRSPVFRLDAAHRGLSRRRLPVHLRAGPGPGRGGDAPAGRARLAPSCAPASRGAWRSSATRSLFRLWMFASGRFRAPSDLLRVDILNCIGVALLLAGAIALPWPRRGRAHRGRARAGGGDRGGGASHLGLGAVAAPARGPGRLRRRPSAGVVLPARAVGGLRRARGRRRRRPRGLAAPGMGAAALRRPRPAGRGGDPARAVGRPYPPRGLRALRLLAHEPRVLRGEGRRRAAHRGRRLPAREAARPGLGAAARADEPAHLLGAPRDRVRRIRGPGRARDASPRPGGGRGAGAAPGDGRALLRAHREMGFASIAEATAARSRFIRRRA